MNYTRGNGRKHFIRGSKSWIAARTLDPSRFRLFLRRYAGSALLPASCRFRLLTFRSIWKVSGRPGFQAFISYVPPTTRISSSSSSSFEHLSNWNDRGSVNWNYMNLLHRGPRFRPGAADTNDR